MKHLLLIGCCAAAILAGNSRAQAQNLIFNNYATGSNINGLWGQQPDPDDTFVNRPLGGTFNFFGVGHTTVDVATNGHLNFSGSGFIPGGGGLPNNSNPVSEMFHT